MSVHLSSVLAAEKLEVKTVLLGHDRYALVRFSARLARELEQGIIRDPQYGDPAHGLVVGDKRESIRRKLSIASEWVVTPDQELLPEET